MNRVEKKIRRFGFSFKSWTERKMQSNAGFFISIIVGLLGMVATMISFMYLLPLTISAIITLLTGLTRQEETIIDLIMDDIGSAYFSRVSITAVILTIGAIFALCFVSDVVINYDKLPEVAIPEAKKKMGKHPDFKEMLTRHISEAEKNDDGDRLGHILGVINEIELLEMQARGYSKKASDLRVQLKREENGG